MSLRVSRPNANPPPLIPGLEKGTKLRPTRRTEGVDNDPPGVGVTIWIHPHRSQQRSPCEQDFFPWISVNHHAKGAVRTALVPSVPPAQVAPRQGLRRPPSQGGPRPSGSGGQRASGPGGRRPSGQGGPRPNDDRPRRPRRTGHPTPKDQGDGGADRIQKVLAHAGIGSRRACEELILAGRVTVNGKGRLANSDPSVIPSGRGRGCRWRENPHREASLLRGLQAQGLRLDQRRPVRSPSRVVDLLPEIPQRVYTVGRLDEMSNGLIILTNDGTLAHKLAHPKYGVEKLYRVVVAGTPPQEVLNQLTEGIWLAEGKVRAKRVRAVGKRGDSDDP